MSIGKKLGYAVAIFIFILGVVTFMKYSLNFAEKISAKFDSSQDFKLRQEEYRENSAKAYLWGRTWGEVSAEAFEAGLDDYIYRDGMNKDEILEVANEIYTNRAVDSYCWGADDCGELPTEEEVKKNWGADFGSKEMPSNAFKSGYMDAFVEYFIRR
ncbi:hypothetical protein G3M74_13295 [Paenibacillus polymyxa]|nr:hypothetical protein [Paenibacillus polymyxa]